MNDPELHGGPDVGCDVDGQLPDLASASSICRFVRGGIL